MDEQGLSRPGYVPDTSTFRDGFAHIRRKLEIGRRPIIKALRRGRLNACIYLGKRATRLVVVPSCFFAEKGGDDFDSTDEGRSVSVRLSELLADLGASLNAVQASIKKHGPHNGDARIKPEGDKLASEVYDQYHPLREFQFLIASSPFGSSEAPQSFDDAFVHELHSEFLEYSDRRFSLHLFDDEVDAFVLDQIGSDRRKPGPVPVDLNEGYWLTLLEKMNLSVDKLPNQKNIVGSMLEWCRDPEPKDRRASHDIAKVKESQIQTQMTEIWRILKPTSRDNK